MRRFTSLLTVLLVTASVVAQPPVAKPPDKPKASAVKLPDGTVVFVTKSADDPNPIVDGVVLSPAEYQALVEQVEAAKKAKEAAKPVPPSGVAVRGAIEARGERTVAAVTLTYTFRTSSPRMSVTLGCQRAAVVSAKAADGKLPVLTVDADGLTVLAEAAGEHVVTVQAEVPVSARATMGEVGFDFALPKAAISTFSLAKPPADGVTKVTVGTRGAELSATTKRTTVTTDSLSAKPLALGPTDLLEVSWEPPGTAATDPGLTADADVRVRVEERQVETVAKLRLKGNAREWQLTLPPTDDVSVAAGGLIPLPAFTATLVKPTEAGKPWLLRTPVDTPGDWVVTVTVRVSRADAADPKSRGPFTVGPFAVGGARPTGKVSVHAPVGIRLGFKPSADLRRQDLPATTDDDLVAVFGTAAAPKSGGWLDIDARPAVGQLRVRPQHRLKLTNTGWKLESTVRVVPPQRAELESFTLDVPPEWAGVDVGPAEFAEVTPEPDGRTYTVRFVTPQKAAFDFTLSALFPVQPGGSASVPLPRFTQAEERETKLTVTVNDGLEVRGTGFGWENGQPAGNGESLKGTGRGSATTTVSGEFDRGASRVELKWQAYRPELACESRAEVTVHPRQLSVTQTFKFVAPEGDVKAVRLRGPEELAGVRAKPALEPVGRGEWEFRPGADPGREFTLAVQFAVPLSVGATSAAVPLLWCDAATRSEATVRVWGGGGPRADGFEGRWRETAPEPAADRNSLPWFTLTAGAAEPLTLNLSNTPDAGGGTVIDRGVIQAAVGADGTAAVRAVYAVRKWPGGGVELEVPGGGLQDVLVDGNRTDPVRTGERVVVPMPEARPGATVILDVRCQGVADGDGRGGRTLQPPAVRGASYRGPVRWYVACPADQVPLVFDHGWDTEHRWGWRGYGVGPGPADSPAEMERWVRDENGGGVATTATGDAVAVRRATADPLRVTLAPRGVWLLVASVAGLLMVVVIGQLRLGMIGPAVAVVAVALAAAAVFLPQPSAQAVAAAQPGLGLGGLLLAAQFGWRWYRSWRAERLPTFSRTLPAPDPSTPSAPRSIRTGSGGSVVPFEARPS